MLLPSYSHLPKKDEKRRFYARLQFSFRLIIVLFALLVVRFVYLQIIQYYRFAHQADDNRITLINLEPSRGQIIDRNGIVLAQNIPSHTLEIIPNKTHGIDETIRQLRQIVPISSKEMKRFNRLKSESKVFEPILLKSKLTDEEVASVAANSWRLPGVLVRDVLSRDYVFPSLTCHVLGYVGRISQRDDDWLKKNNKTDAYRGATYIGRFGLEAFYEDILRGQIGFEAIETNAKGQALKVLRSQMPMDGNTLKLTLDIRLQELADKLFGQRRGALVAINPQTGEIIAFLSKPSFDANLFVDGIDYETWDQLNNNWQRPLLNRALYGLYPPGSTLKPFIAMAALHRYAIGYDDKRFSPGSFSLPNSRHQFRDSKRAGHGSINLQQAIMVSSDTFFYRLAWEMGIDALHPLLRAFGLGQKTGIDLPGESKGILPSRQWKQKRFAKAKPIDQKWLPADTVSIGIGQGYNAYTPLQMAHAVAILANNGYVVRPHLLREIIPANSKKGQLFNVKVTRKLSFRQADFDYVKQGMEKVLQKDGTARHVGVGLKYRMAGKTGTAQVVRIRQSQTYNSRALPEQHRDHAWFIAFAPAQKPTFAIAVVVENVGWGAVSAAPIARALTDFYLYGIIPPNLKGKLKTVQLPTINQRPLKKRTLPKKIPAHFSKRDALGAKNTYLNAYGKFY